MGIKPIVFTASFREAVYDETPYAKIMAKKYNLEHHISTIDSGALQHLETISGLYDNPIADRAVLPEYVICQAARELGVDYMLSGEGGDEVMGYPRNLPEDIPPTFGAHHSNSQIARYYYGVSALANDSVRRELLPLQDRHNYLAGLYAALPEAAPFEKIYYGQWQTWLIDNVLMKDLQLFGNAKMSFVSPFISRTLMQYMATVPLDKKLEGLHGKTFVKQALGAALPDEIIHKVKHKFHVPISEWFQGEAHGLLHDTLLASDGFCMRYMGEKAVGKLLEHHKAGEQDYNRPLWALLFLTFWHKEKERQVYG
jgi:asparagine synthase (glutamine-hydrolysing)